MSYYIFKVLVTGAIIIIITELAKLNLRLAALITALPLVTLICITWMYYEGLEKKEIANYVLDTVKYLIPTIPALLVFPFLIEKTNFYIAMLFCIVLVVVCLFLLNLLFSVLDN